MFVRSSRRDVVGEQLARIARDQDDLRRDLAQAERLLGEGFERLRDNLVGVLERSGTRFRSADEAASGLDRWEDRD